MAMTVLNNTAAQMTLGELNKNITRVGKDLKKIAKGERLTGAGDGAADFAISEKMRELVRSLGQNERNVQTGASLLKVAEGGVQEQLELLKTVKEKVLNAANDSNTDEDRAIIQKEIDQAYSQMEDIAQTTNYNGKRLLAGDVTEIGTEIRPTEITRLVLHHGEPFWVKFDEPQFIENSDAQLINDVYDKLDDLDGPFDVFEELKPAINGVDITTLGLKAASNENKFEGGLDGDPKIITFDLAGKYSTSQSLDGKGFSIGKRKYVFSYNNTYDPDEYTSIDISSASNLSDVANLMASKLGTSPYNITVEGTKLTFTSSYTSDLAVNINADPNPTGISGPSTTAQRVKPGTGTPATYAPESKTLTVATQTIPNLPATFSGGENGRDPVYETKLVPDPKGDDVDRKTTYHVENIEPPIDPGEPGKRASVTMNFYGIPTNTTIKLHGRGDAYLQFVDGNSAPTLIKGEKGDASNPKIYQVGKNYKGVSKLKDTDGDDVTGIEVDMSKGLSNVVFRDSNTRGGSSPNGKWTISAQTSDIPYTVQKKVSNGTPEEYETITYPAVTALDTTGMVITKSGTDATYAKYNMTFSNTDNIESMIGELNGKSIKFSSGVGYAFVDSAALNDRPGGVFVGLIGNKLDLNELRTLAKTEGSNLKALQTFLKNHISYNKATEIENGLQIQAVSIGTPGNNEYISTSEAGLLRHIDMDFSGKNPSDLIGKGFRVYCATDENEWWNFQFTDKQDPEFEAEKPAGESDSEIKTIRIDISGAKNSGDIVKAVFDQAAPKLTGERKFNHNLRIEANPNTSVLRLYDKRTNELNSTNYDTLMGKGGDGLDPSKGWWKVADGIIDDVQMETGDKWVPEKFIEDVSYSVARKDFVIHDNPRANRNIHLKLPVTTIDKILDFDKSEQSAEDFNVITKEMRDKLLGYSKDEMGNELLENGIIDKGILYLTDANVLIGSQIQRLNLSEANIVNKIETATASESTIRDADMAKEMASFAKNNVLAQASQSMLAQANQSASSVLSLLQ